MRGTYWIWEDLADVSGLSERRYGHYLLRAYGRFIGILSSCVFIMRYHAKLLHHSLQKCTVKENIS